MSISIAYTKNYTSTLDAIYQRVSVSGCLTSGRRMVRAGHNAKEIVIPKIEVFGIGDYTRNVGCKMGSINYVMDRDQVSMGSRILFLTPQVPNDYLAELRFFWLLRLAVVCFWPRFTRIASAHTSVKGSPIAFL